MTRYLIDLGRKLIKRESGEINVGAIMLMGIGMVFLAVGFIMFPIVTTATDGLLDYSYAAYPTITATTYTGFTAVMGITPLLVLIGYLSAAVFSMFLGVKMTKGEGSSNLSLGSLLMLGISMVFIAIAMIIMPVALDGVSSVVAHSASISENTSADTGVGITTANYTLTQRLYNDNIAEVLSVTTNVSSDAPITITSYTYPKLLIGSLTANVTRTVTTGYYYADELASYTGIYPVLLVTPLLILISFLSGTVITGFFGLKGIAGG